ncbi:hypothetical protein B0H14DRAFT_2782302, partial [Mycena olivaceomarginata]
MMRMRTTHAEAGRTYGHHPHPDPALAATHKYTSRAATWYPLTRHIPVFLSTRARRAPGARRPRLGRTGISTRVRGAMRKGMVAVGGIMIRGPRCTPAPPKLPLPGAWFRRDTKFDGDRTLNSASYCAKSAPKKTVRCAEEDMTGICMHGMIEKAEKPA